MTNTTSKTRSIRIHVDEGTYRLLGARAALDGQSVNEAIVTAVGAHVRGLGQLAEPSVPLMVPKTEPVPETYAGDDQGHDALLAAAGIRDRR